MQPSRIFVLCLLAVLLVIQCRAQDTASNFAWPEGKRVAISLTFDDGRDSQVLSGTPLLDEFGVKGTFYVLPSAIERHPGEWKQALKNGHEIGNHSVVHPCSGNFPWARSKALEEYSIRKMKTELKTANEKIETLLNIEPIAFAYPCGQTFIGSGTKTKSYVPVVADLFMTGRVWMSEAPNDPLYCDFAQLTGVESDGKDFEDLLPIIESARKNGQWLVLAGHEMGEPGPQTTRLTMLRELLKYSQDPANGIWIAPVSTVAKYVQEKRTQIKNESKR